MTARKVAIVGAGPSGLAAAFALIERAEAQREPVDITIFEASDRPGGAIGTDAIEGFLVERGADGFITEKPALIDLARRLGIEHRLIKPLPSRVGAWVVKEGELLPMPGGFSMMAPTSLRAFARSPLISWPGKLRAACEMALPRGPGGGDESLASFVRRRFGNEVLERLAQPLVGGIYGADPELLSLRATMPRFLDEERESRSVTLGLRRKARQGAAEAKGARYSLFASFDRGMQVLVDALVSRLPEGALRLSSPVQQIRPDGEGAYLTAGGEERRYDRVILALSSRAARGLVEPFDAEMARALGAIHHGSCATVNLGFRRRFPALEGYGLVVPTVERRSSIAMTFASRKWQDRAPADGELIRVFIGEGLAREPEARLIELARAELRALLGVDDEPRFAVVRPYVEAMPHYHVGHLDRACAVERMAGRHRWLAVAGNSLRGVGVPDTIRSGEAAAQQIFAPARAAELRS